MKFYTNIVRYGNNLLIREVNNGERVNTKVKYSPTMFMRVSKETRHKSLIEQIGHPAPCWQRGAKCKKRQHETAA